MRETFDIFFEGDKLLNVLVLAGGRGEDRVVDYDAVNGGVDVRSQDCFFDFFFINFSKVELKATRE